MATLNKEYVIFNPVDSTLADLDSETVEVIARDGTYPGDAISCTAGSGADYRFIPASDLDTTKSYYVYVGGNKVGWFNGWDARNNFMGESVYGVLNLTVTGNAAIGGTLGVTGVTTLIGGATVPSGKTLTAETIQAVGGDGVTIKDDAGTPGLVINDGATATIPKTVSIGSSGGTTGQITLIASDNDQMTIAANTSDQMAFAGASGGYTFSDGNVGIGTTAPGSLLHVYKSGAVTLEVESNTDNATFIINSNTDGVGLEKSVINFQDNSVTKWSISKSDDNNLLIFDGVRGGALLRAFANGNLALMEYGGDVGIGTTAPTTKLHQAQFSADALGNYHTFSKSRNATAGSHTVVQDNDIIGGINFAPSDGTDFGTISAQIKSSVDDASPAASSIGGDITFSTAKGAGADDLTLALTITKDQYAVFNSRVQGLKGSDVASANGITLGAGNYFYITGTTTINRIYGEGWQSGSLITLQFADSLTVTHGQAAGSGYYGLKLAGMGDFSATVFDTLQLIFDGSWWWETSRTVI